MFTSVIFLSALIKHVYIQLLSSKDHKKAYFSSKCLGTCNLSEKQINHRVDA